MTEAQRKTALERIAELTSRNTDLNTIINVSELWNASIQVLQNIITENEKTIQELIKVTDKRYEFLFNFKGGGWNSEWAYTLEEAQELARKNYSDPKYRGVCDPDYSTFRVSTPADYRNLMSMFY
jgi:hypothetical protein